MFYMLLLLAEAEKAPTTTPTTSTPSPFGDMLIPLMGIFALFYFLILRPKRKEEQERQSLLSSIKKNDKVITHAGIYGTVVSVSEKEDEIVVKVDDNVRLKMLKASIMRNLTNEEAAKEAKNKGKTQDKAAEDKPSSTAITPGNH
jgi:preprotein translocase subunit YajC